MEHYRMDNTAGYTAEELAALNSELEALLADARWSSDDTLSSDEAEKIIKRHADEVARR